MKIYSVLVQQVVCRKFQVACEENINVYNKGRYYETPPTFKNTFEYRSGVHLFFFKFPVNCPLSNNKSLCYCIVFTLTMYGSSSGTIASQSCNSWQVEDNLSRSIRKPKFCFPTWSSTNQAVQLQKMARGLQFHILKVEGLYYL